ncbi:uncharacterized protein H6S33_011129 [Morchella sextelata]|uniref:uncharacterized protein n=1 Tax=Morchella sextelata TaxID=1174677 RepID=UPI001D04F8F8|nr:uncharacterized protein H6S33_011129 [Morchella sextelata]KAH0611864.1 hypothetical protein H6S33_011129 [Morchella sextelata]
MLTPFMGDKCHNESRGEIGQRYIRMKTVIKIHSKGWRPPPSAAYPVSALQDLQALDSGFTMQVEIDFEISNTSIVTASHTQRARFLQTYQCLEILKEEWLGMAIPFAFGGAESECSSGMNSSLDIL